MGRENKKTTVITTASSVGEFLDHVDSIVGEWFPDKDEPYGPWFRGQQRANWNLRPNLYRHYGLDKIRLRKIEDETREEFIIRAPILSDIKPGSVDDWECYFLMQHHGAPTRLLDWTQGALIGLFFAVKDNPGFYDAAVWVLDPFRLNQQARGFSKDEVIPPSANIAKHDKVKIDKWLPDRFPLKRIKNRVKLPTDAVAIYPTHIARRISTQRSCFTIFGEDENGIDKFVNLSGGFLKKIIIPAHAVRDLKTELETCGIDESTVYPDLEGLSRQISSWWKLDNNRPHGKVYTKLAPSQVHKGGVGVFAIVDIKKNSPIFSGENEEMLWVDESVFKKSPIAIRRLYRDFAVYKKGKTVKQDKYGCPINFNRLTMSWYINEPNSGTSPNVRCDGNCDFYALRNIKAGQELTVKYSGYSDEMPNWLQK